MFWRACTLAVSVAFAVLPLPASAPDAPLTAATILAKVKAGLRTGERPKFVVYTLVRRESLENAPDFLNSYTLRIWCRTADSAALSRRVAGSRARGPAEFITPAFDKPIDPGPPTADLLDVIAQTQAGTTSAPPSSPPVAGALPIIGSVSVVIERHYHVRLAGVDRSDYHLGLEALRDADHNRLTDLYVDRSTYALHRAVAHDHLYAAGRVIPERFEIEFGSQAGIPVITAIHGQTDYALLDARDGEPFHAVDYRFESIAFPDELPAWYFEPGTYGDHRSELPF